MWWAADAPASGGSDTLIVLIFGLITALITGGVTVVVAVINRGGRTAASPPPVEPGTPVSERVAVVEVRTDQHARAIEDLEDALDVLDRRVNGNEIRVERIAKGRDQ